MKYCAECHKRIKSRTLCPACKQRKWRQGKRDGLIYLRALEIVSSGGWRCGNDDRLKVAAYLRERVKPPKISWEAWEHLLSGRAEYIPKKELGIVTLFYPRVLRLIGCPPGSSGDPDARDPYHDPR